MEVKTCDTQQINQINTCYPTTSWSETPVRPIDKNGPILPIVCWSDISGGSTQYQSVNGCFSWLPHWTGRRLGCFSGTSAGSNSLSLALIHTWESDDLCLLLLATHTITFFISLRAYFWGNVQILVVGWYLNICVVIFATSTTLFPVVGQKSCPETRAVEPPPAPVPKPHTFTAFRHFTMSPFPNIVSPLPEINAENGEIVVGLRRKSWQGKIWEKKMKESIETVR